MSPPQGEIRGLFYPQEKNRPGGPHAKTGLAAAGAIAALESEDSHRKKEPKLSLLGGDIEP